MKRLHFIYILFIASLVSCTHTPEEKLTYLEGYWEIAEVASSNGGKKTFSMSQNIDFFDIQDQKRGIRKKVQPDLGGNFTTSKSSENIDIEINDDTIVLTYTTAFDSWKETVIEASKDQLILLNENGTTYTYRRYEPILLPE
ncbi:hypothetical protein ACFO3O_21780 [Dokdonia ponticola]|uniref:Lipocalin-like domain-containing protein n=1 Tax=Dokdonia ponticola TaxID=2041041 RepID=A0ABV9I4E1_9FLAO